MNELRAAVLANNPDMDQDQRSLMDSDLDKLSSFIDTASSTRTIVGGMVEVVDMQDFAFMGNWRYNPNNKTTKISRVMRTKRPWTNTLLQSKSDNLTFFNVLTRNDIN